MKNTISRNKNCQTKIFYKQKSRSNLQIADGIEKILKSEGKNNSGINIIFTNDDEIRQINLDFRLKNSTTDVISFPLTQKKKAYAGGDVFISVDTAKRDAEKYGFDLDDELSRLLVHGTLHIIGYDHIKRKEEKLMEIKEKKYRHIFYSEND